MDMKPKVLRHKFSWYLKKTVMKQEQEQSQWEKKLEVENEGFRNHCRKFKLMIYV